MLLVRQWIHVPASLRVSHTFYVNVNSDPEVTPWLSLSTETGTHSENCAAALPVEMAQVQFLDNLLTRYVQRQVLWSRCSLGQGVRPFFPRHVHYWSRQCRKPWNCRSCSSHGCVDVAASCSDKISCSRDENSGRASDSVIDRVFLT